MVGRFSTGRRLEHERLAAAVIVLALLSLAGSVYSSPPSAEDDRPRIGLALGGGGARGGAHIGVLRVLEELRIPIDYIAGTSIGSIVGGLYASGLSPDEMSAEISRIDWEDVFDDAPPRRQRSFRRKEEDLRDLFAAEVGFNRHGFQIPSGLVAGQKLNFVLRGVALHTAGIDDFDELGIPFRAVATDLETGGMAVIRDGDLTDAMRASMAIPGFFTPVRQGERILVDGGLVRNLPVDVVRDMGADLIIAVDVWPRLPPLDADPSLLSVVHRTMGVLTGANTREAHRWLTGEDILITPELEGITILDFEDMIEAELGGTRAAESLVERLESLSVSDDEYETYLRRLGRSNDRLGDSPVVGEIRIVGLHRVHDAMIRRRVLTRPGEALDLDVLRGDLGRIYEMGEFETVDFRVLHERIGDGSLWTVLEIEVDERSIGPNYLRAGVRIEGDLSGEGGFLFNVLFRRSIVHRYRAEWRNFITLGDYLAFDTEFYQLVGGSERWFVAPRARYESDQGASYLAPTRELVADGHVWQVELDVGIRGGADLEARAGVVVGRLKSRVFGPSASPSVEADVGRWTSKFALDQLDAAAFPTLGGYSDLRIDLSRRNLGATDEYDRLLWRGLKPLTSGRNTLLGTLEFGTDLGSDLPVYDDFRLGGPLRLSGFDRDQFRGDRFAFASLTAYRRLVDMNRLIGSGLFGGAGIETGSILQSDAGWSLGEFVLSGSVLFGLDSVIGPLYLVYGWGEGGSHSFHLTLGHVRRLGTR